MSEQVCVRSDLSINGVKVFSATTYSHRERLGDLVTTWLHEHSDLAVVSVTVSQSSDAEFYCLSIVLYYHEWHTAS
jgi:hypothetical protein